jgi:hypothetical protein
MLMMMSPIQGAARIARAMNRMAKFRTINEDTCALPPNGETAKMLNARFG